jgi:hypothetical protein
MTTPLKSDKWNRNFKPTKNINLTTGNGGNCEVYSRLLSDVLQCFGGKDCLHLQGRRVEAQKKSVMEGVEEGQYSGRS